MKIYAHKVAERAREDEQVEDRVEVRRRAHVEQRSHGVRDAAGDEPRERPPGEHAQQRFERERANPPHDNVNEHGVTLNRVEKEEFPE